MNMRGYVGYLIKGLWANKIVRYIIIALAVIFLALFSLNRYGNTKYQDGIAYQQQKDELIQKQLKEKIEKLQAQADLDRQNLNKEIEDQKKAYAELQLQRQNKSDKIQDEVNDYAKTSDGNKLGLSSNWMRIYKDSLPQ